MENLNFGQALEAVKKGKLISREGWNGKGMFVFLNGTTDCFFQEGNNNDEHIMDIPVNVMNKLRTDTKGCIVSLSPFLSLKAADNTIVRGWLASQSDMLANDWCILD